MNCTDLSGNLLNFFLRKAGRWLPDRLYLVLRYLDVYGFLPDLNTPRRFSEVVLWTKTRDRNPLYHILADKVEVKDYVAGKIGAEHVIPTLGVWESADDIDWDALPDRFVVKCSHDSGSTLVCRDRSSFNTGKAREHLREALGNDFSRRDREWAYKGLRPRIIAEKYLCDNPVDYKFFCFDGKPSWLFIATDRGVSGEETKFDFFDMEFRHLDVRNGHPNAPVPPAKPSSFEEMKKLAAVLSEGIPQVRIDFYEAGGRVYFGEYTFCHWGGYVPFDPDEADIALGSFFRLPSKKD